MTDMGSLYIRGGDNGFDLNRWFDCAVHPAHLMLKEAADVFPPVSFPLYW